MTNKERYIQFCDKEALPLFLQPWWMDAVTEPDEKKWDVLLACNKQGEIEAAMPFVTGSKLGMRYALTPQLTQYTGVWIKDKEGEDVTGRLSREKKLQNDIIEQLKALRIRYFDVKFPLSYTYWSPFYWAGYKQETHYTYRIEDMSNIDNVFARFDYAKQKQIRKAQNAGITVDFDMTVDELYDLQCTQLSVRGSKDYWSRVLVRSIMDHSRSRGQGLIVRAKDKDGNTHAAVGIVWDDHNAWEILSAIHPNYQTSGASTLVVWEAMQQAAQKTKAWDFEGSMIEGVENSFRQFGGVPTPYFEIKKYSKWIELLLACRK